MRTLLALCAAFTFGCMQLAHAGAPMRIVPDVYSPDLYRGHMRQLPQREAPPLKGCVTCKIVPYKSPEAPGTIVVDSRDFHLYFVQTDGTAIRYGIGVARDGFGWNDVVEVKMKRKWPDWHPPREMIARSLKEDPSYLEDNLFMRDAHGSWYTPGGLGNPLGARALYLFKGAQDTLYRIHGTWEPSSIGRNVSSGCIRMRNEDVVDLYNRVQVGAKVIVH